MSDEGAVIVLIFKGRRARESSALWRGLCQREGGGHQLMGRALCVRDAYAGRDGYYEKPISGPDGLLESAGSAAGSRRTTVER